MSMNVQGPTPAVFRPLVTAAAGSPKAAPSPAAPAPAQASADKTLWDVLTDEERAFFTQQAQLGAVSYRPARSAPPAASAPMGQRIDVRG